MIPLAPNAPTDTHRAIQPARHASAERLHATRKRILVVCFDDEMQVIALNREVNDSKPSERRLANRSADDICEALLPKRGQPSTRSHRDVKR
jgi:hypothetical protein